MKFFSTSPAIPRTSPPVPQDAPRLPAKSHSFGIVLFSVMFGLVVLITEFQPLLTFLVIVGVSVWWCVHLAHRRFYNRVGWYERREVVLPKLPHAMHGYDERILFGLEDVTFSPNRHQKNAVKRIIPYTDIAEVHTQCSGLCLTGVELTLRAEGPESVQTRVVVAGIVLGIQQTTKFAAPIAIPEGLDGEQARTSLAILRSKAPHATFSGPQWIEEGWMPRRGFECPSYSVGSGGGP